jgi:methylenetetrahydrofolate dehydrogenase (NADP+) / methenyltetrahydrofolate cyclohydrolase
MMAASIIDGKGQAAQITDAIAMKVRERVATGKLVPGLAVVLVGDHEASQIYVRNKRRTTDGVGMRSMSFDLPVATMQHELLALIDRLNADPGVQGILVQLPLPKHIDADLVTERILPDKDVDGFHPYNIGRLVLKRPRLRPCTPYGCMLLLRSTGQDLVGKHAVVIGQSNIVGRPMALELLMARCTVTICHSATRDLPAIVAGADIVVAAMGKLRYVQGEWIKPGAMVIDVGTNRTPEGKLRGDVDFESAKQRAGWITPVPGGVGPMTIAMLLANTLTAAELQDATVQSSVRSATPSGSAADGSTAPPMAQRLP